MLSSSTHHIHSTHAEHSIITVHSTHLVPVPMHSSITYHTNLQALRCPQQSPTRGAPAMEEGSPGMSRGRGGQRLQQKHDIVQILRGVGICLPWFLSHMEIHSKLKPSGMA